MKTDTIVDLILIAVVLIVVAIAGGAKAAWHHTHVDYVTATVAKMERVNYGDTSKYLVWADVQDEQGTHPETFENTGAWFFGKWNSSDVYGQLEVGKTYKFKVSGLRWRFMSWYRNIIEVAPVNTTIQT